MSPALRRAAMSNGPATIWPSSKQRDVKTAQAHFVVGAFPPVNGFGATACVIAAGDAKRVVRIEIHGLLIEIELLPLEIPTRHRGHARLILVVNDVHLQSATELVH